MNANLPDRKPKALLLAADSAHLASLRRGLEGRGFEVLTACDGEEGVSILLDALLDLDVLVTELDLPGRDGWSILHLLRVAGGERDLPIVVVERGVRGELRAHLLTLGADVVVDRAAGPGAIADAAFAAASVAALPARPVRASSWTTFLPVPVGAARAWGLALKAAAMA